MGCTQSCISEKSFESFSLKDRSIRLSINREESKLNQEPCAFSSLEKLTPSTAQSFKKEVPKSLEILDGPLSEHYTLECQLGEGIHSRAFKGIHKESNSMQAVKIIRKPFYHMEEVDILGRFIHKGTVKVYKLIDSSETLAVISELCTGGEIFDRVLSFTHMSENLAANLLLQIISALDFCHNLGLVHRNLKPENILFANKTSTACLKITDFVFSNKSLPTFGNVYYAAPELFKGQACAKSDVWSAGVIFYTLLCGFPPFNGESEDEIAMRVRRAVYTFQEEVWGKISKEAKSLIRQMLVKDPKRRLSTSEILANPWLQERGNNLVNDNILPGKTLENLANFQGVVKVRQATLGFIASSLIVDREIEELQSVFEGLDTRGDGRVSVDDINKGLDHLGVDYNIQEIIESSDQEGVIDYTEFLNMNCHWKKIGMKQTLEDTYQKHQVESCGIISVQELKEFVGETITEDAWRHVFGEAGFTEDGIIHIDEFRSFILNH